MGFYRMYNHEPCGLTCSAEFETWVQFTQRCAVRAAWTWRPEITTKLKTP